MKVHLIVVLVAMFAQLTVTLSLLALPYITHRDLLFGVPVPNGFRETETGRSVLKSFRLWIAVPGAASLLAMILLPYPLLHVIVLFTTAVIGVATFVAMNRRLKPFAIQPPLVHQVELTPSERLPWFTWLGILPLFLLAGCAAYLHAHWDQIPLRYPVHFDLNGNPNRWSDRTTRGVYGPLILGGEFSLVLFGMVLAGWYGSRRSDPMRKPMIIVMLAVEATMALMFSFPPLRLAGGIAIPIPAMIFGPMLILIPAMYYAYKKSIEPRDPIDPTPNECWKGGMIYYNANDAALFVPRRDGLGFTVNLANRWSWLLYGGWLLAIASMPFVLR